MRIGWVIATVLVAVLGCSGILLFLRRNRSYHAQVAATLMLLYGWVILFLWATESDLLVTPEVNVAGFAKAALLSLSGGWLAQVALALNRLANRFSHKGRVLPIFIRAVLGALCGFVAAALASIPYGEFGALPDEVAGLAGVAGGAAGVSVFDVVRQRFLK